jgi:septal ring factor EnvC (AmiA/AmiB activator)
MHRRATLTCAILTALLALPARGQEPAEDPEALAARAAARIAALRAEADRLAGQARTIFTELRKLEVEQNLSTQQYVRATADLTALSRDRSAAMTALIAAEARRVADTPGLEQRLVELYKRGRGGYARLLLSSDDVRAFGRTTRGVAALAAVDRARVEAHRRVVAAERAAFAEVERQRAAVAAAQKDAARARAAADAAVAARNRLIDDLDQRRDLAAQYVAELESAQAALQQTVAEIGRPGADAAALPLRPFRGDLDWPVRGRVATRFGKSTAGRFRTSIVRNGIDISVAEGTPVHAIHGGVVGFAAPFTGYGTMVILDHGGGAFSLYGHLADTTVKPGTRVARGAPVGTVGLPPLGPAALYFELRVDGRPVDPLQWLRSSP